MIKLFDLIIVHNKIANLVRRHEFFLHFDLSIKKTCCLGNRKNLTYKFKNFQGNKF